MWKEICEELKLNMPPAFRAATEEDIDLRYNGIGPDQMPDFIANYLRKLGVPEEQIAALCVLARKVVSDILTKFQPPAVVHDFEFSGADKSDEAFHEANARLLENCKRIIAKDHSWTCYMRPWTGEWKERAKEIAVAELLYYACERYGLQAWRAA